MEFINRIKKKLSGKSQYDLQDLLNEVKKISANYSELIICPENTDANWLGIKNATLAMFPDKTFIIPQNYSNQIVSDNDLRVLIKTFSENNGKRIILSGFPEYFYKIINYSNNLNLNVEFIFHGGLAELNQNTASQRLMENIFKFAKSGKISKIYVVKEGLDKLFTALTQVKTIRITPPVSIDENLNLKKFNDNKIHIGVFGNNSYNKNRHIQVAAAALIPDSIVHVIGENEFSYLLPKHRVITHEQMSRKEFLEILGSMDINLYCSYSESWGQVTLESLALGVPCLTGNNSGIIHKLRPEEKKYVLNIVDNPFVIANKIVESLNLAPLE